jgi:hypothetical protein
MAADEAKLLVRVMKLAARTFSEQSSAMDWEWSREWPTVPPRLVGATAQMRFYVSGYEPPRR